jgi:hypothetical protein
LVHDFISTSLWFEPDPDAVKKPRPRRILLICPEALPLTSQLPRELAYELTTLLNLCGVAIQPYSTILYVGQAQKNRKNGEMVEQPYPLYVTSCSNICTVRKKRRPVFIHYCSTFDDLATKYVE